MALSALVALTVNVGAGRLSKVGDTSKKLTVWMLPLLSVTTDLPSPALGPTLYTSVDSVGAFAPAVCCRMVWLKPSSPAMGLVGLASAASQSMPWGTLIRPFELSTISVLLPPP